MVLSQSFSSNFGENEVLKIVPLFLCINIFGKWQNLQFPIFRLKLFSPLLCINQLSKILSKFKNVCSASKNGQSIIIR
jgi:hypothetical protein